ncbi:MAG: YtxH domain-containing protein [Anaerolineaceae bacterium]|nr:YtxH domain-containing protein [Anaerolineaceae bacterium]
MAERDDFGAFLLGFIIGGMAGAVTALLMAPQSGDETRTLIREKAIEIKDKAGESVDEAYAQAEKAAIEAQERFQELAAMTKERSAELAAMTKEKSAELQKKGQIVLEEQKSKLEEKLQPKKKVEIPIEKSDSAK